MKKVLKSAAVLLAIVALSSTAYSQGQIGFANNPVTAGIKDMSGVNVGVGTTTVGLYWAAAATAGDPDSFELGGTAPIALPGTFNNGGSPLSLSASAGTAVLVEIRAWDNGAASYEEALALGTGNAGRSGVLTQMTLTAPPSSPENLVIQGGFRGFALSPVPEPSTIALGILGGLGAMVLLRRRK